MLVNEKEIALPNFSVDPKLNPEIQPYEAIFNALACANLMKSNGMSDEQIQNTNIVLTGPYFLRHGAYQHNSDSIQLHSSKNPLSKPLNAFLQTPHINHSLYHELKHRIDFCIDPKASTKYDRHSRFSRLLGLLVGCAVAYRIDNAVLYDLSLAVRVVPDLCLVGWQSYITGKGINAYTNPFEVSALYFSRSQFSLKSPKPVLIDFRRKL